MREHTAINTTAGRSYWIPSAVLIVAVIAVTFLPDIQDYQDYGRQWMSLARGGNPWFDAAGRWNANAYGPLHSIFAFPFSWWDKLPRLLLVFTWVIVGLLLFRADNPKSESPGLQYLLAFWASPYLWAEIVLYSHTDLFVAALCLAALLCAQRERPVLAGILLASGISMKLYPIALLPFFAVRKGRLEWRWLLSAVLTIAAMYGAAYLLWGSTVWQSLTFAAGRGSSPFSIFYFLKSPGSPLRLFSAQPDVDWLSLPMLALGGALLWITYIRNRWTLGFGVVAAFSLVLSLYKVGHEQFEMFLYLGVLLLWWYSDFKIPKDLRTAIVVYFAWAGFRAISSTVLSHLHVFSQIRWSFCVPNFAVLVFLLTSLIRWGVANRDAGSIPGLMMRSRHS